MERGTGILKTLSEYCVKPGVCAERHKGSWRLDVGYRKRTLRQSTEENQHSKDSKISESQVQRQVAGSKGRL